MLFPSYKVLILDRADASLLQRSVASVASQTLDNVTWTVAEGAAEGIAELDPAEEDVVVFLEGTDWLFNERTLHQLHEAYLRYDLLFTSSFYLHHPTGRVGGAPEPHPRLVLKGDYRKLGWWCPGLKSCKGKLLHGIELDEPSLSYTLLERAGPHVHFFQHVQVVQGTEDERPWPRR
ncbi:MAG: hypothetical protein AB7F31_02160 [Parachlamydiales bacterium]